MSCDFNLLYLHFSVSLPVITLRINFVLYSIINSKYVQLWHKRGLLIYILIFNHTIPENYINLSNKESFCEHYEVMISVGARSNLQPLLN